MTRSKKSNLINNRKVTKNFIKTPKDIIHKNNMKPITRLIYIYLLGLDARKVNVSNNLISSFFKISEPSVARAIKELKDNKLIDIERVGKKDYIYTILEQGQESQEDAEQDQEEQQESQAEQEQEEQEIKEDFEEMTENEKKIYKFNDLYKQYCTSCTKIIKDVKESKIIYIMDKYNEIDIIKTLKEFNKFIGVNEGKYKDNYKYLITNFGRLFKKETNKFNNFTQRNYTKSDFKKLEKSFFNNNDIANQEPVDESERELTQRAIFELFIEKQTKHKNYTYKDFNKELEELTEDKTYSINLMNELNHSSVRIKDAKNYQMILNDIEDIREIESNCRFNNFEQHTQTKKDVEEIEEMFYV